MRVIGSVTTITPGEFLEIHPVKSSIILPLILFFQSLNCYFSDGSSNMYSGFTPDLRQCSGTSGYATNTYKHTQTSILSTMLRCKFGK